MERIEDRSKALSYIGIEIAEALKYIPAPLGDLEGTVEKVQVEQEIVKVPVAKANIPANIETTDDTTENEVVNKKAFGTTVVPNETQIQSAEVYEEAEDTYFEETRFDVKPSLWQRIKNSRFMRTVKFIMSIKVVLDYPALPEGRGENY